MEKVVQRNKLLRILAIDAALVTIAIVLPIISHAIGVELRFMEPMRLTLFAAVLFVIIGRKRIQSMRVISRRFGMIVLIGVAFIFVSKIVYSTAATRGYLGEEARVKYENQTRTGSGIMNLLMSGRAEAFIGLFACFDSPWFGKGPWAVDTEGYTERFIQ